VNDAHLQFCASPEWRQMVEQIVLPEALRQVELGTDVIEIGPGPGFTTDVLRTLTDHLTAVEIDPALASALGSRLAGTNVEVVCGDATALDLPRARFTGAASFHMLHHVPTVEAQDVALSELARVLVPGGVLVAADGVASDAGLAFHAGDTYNTIEVDGLEDRVRRAGFSSVEIRLHDFGWICTGVAV
jgi:SAM-dependent methyltransferase